MNTPHGKDPRANPSRIINRRRLNYLGTMLLGVALLWLVDLLTPLEFISGLIPDSRAGGGEGMNHVLVSAIAVLIITLPTVFYNWDLRNKDAVESHSKTDAHLSHIERQQLETIYSNSRMLLLNPDSVDARAEGLKELIRLRNSLRSGNERDDSVKERIDSLTSIGLNLKGASLAKASFREADLWLAVFQDANLSFSDFRGANLGGAVLQGSDLKFATLNQADLSGADLSGAFLYDAVLLGSILRGAKLSRAKLNRARLGDADLSRADLGEADLGEALISGTNFEEADLEGANLRGLNFENANLKGANLENANLEGADLRSADLDNANLKGANLKGTMMPDS